MPLDLALERLLDKIDVQEDCWVWTGGTNSLGYGVTTFRGRRSSAQRTVYEALVEQVSPALEIDHLCRNRICVNPDHLEPVSPRENRRRSESFAGINARKTHCHRGHPLSGENLYLVPRKGRNPSRACRTCRREARNGRTV